MCLLPSTTEGTTEFEFQDWVSQHVEAASRYDCKKVNIALHRLL